MNSWRVSTDDTELYDDRPIRRPVPMPATPLDQTICKPADTTAKAMSDKEYRLRYTLPEFRPDFIKTSIGRKRVSDRCQQRELDGNGNNKNAEPETPPNDAAGASNRKPKSILKNGNAKQLSGCSFQQASTSFVFGLGHTAGQRMSEQSSQTTSESSEDESSPDEKRSRIESGPSTSCAEKYSESVSSHVSNEMVVTLEDSSHEGEDIIYEGAHKNNLRRHGRIGRGRHNGTTETDSSSSSGSDTEEVDFPFAKGRNPVDVDDPIVIVPALLKQLRTLKEELAEYAIPVFQSLGELVSPDRKHVSCHYCSDGKFKRSYIVAHYTSRKHLQKVVDNAEVFSIMEDTQQLATMFRGAKDECISKEVHRVDYPETVMPFMHGFERHDAEKLAKRDPGYRIQSFKKIYNRLRKMYEIGLFTNGFSNFLFNKFRVPHRNMCSYCGTTYYSIEHLLDLDHVANVMIKGEVFTSYCWNRLKHALQRHMYYIGNSAKNVRGILWQIEKASQTNEFSEEFKMKDLQERIDRAQPCSSQGFNG